MPNYPHILARLRRTVWASTPETVDAVSALLDAAMSGGLNSDLTAQTNDRRMPAMSAQANSMFGENTAESAPYHMHGSTAVIPVFGVVGKHLSSMEILCGGLDVDALCSVVDAAVADESVEQAVLWFNSPGGVVTGVPEAARRIAAANKHKKFYAYTDGMCCSAAYWLAAQCEHIFAAPSSDVGSIGVYLSWIDQTDAALEQGLKLELIKAGDFKAMGHPLQHLSDEERNMLQAEVDEIWDMFKAACTATRSLDDSTMQGQTFSYDSQLSSGLVDAHIDSIGELLADLAAAS